MSIPVEFQLYDDKWEFLRRIRPFTVSYGGNPSDLNLLHRRLMEVLSDATVSHFVTRDFSGVSYIRPLYSDFCFTYPKLELIPYLTDVRGS